jgi:hypothetical protein
MKSPFLTILLAALFIYSCDQCKNAPPDGGDPVLCKNGYVNVNDDCVCPPENYEAYGVCQALRANEFFGVSDCSVKDTMFLWFYQGLASGVNNYKCIGRNQLAHLSNQLPYSNSGGFFDYYTLPDGDSIGLISGLLVPTKFGDTFCEGDVTGKFIHPDTILMHITWRWVHDQDSILETCQMKLHR